MDTRTHWEEVYGSKSAEETSWYEPHLEVSLAWISDAGSTSASIIDVGGGESTLVDDLLAKGYRALTVLDLSSTAIHKAQMRLGPESLPINWLVGDVTTYGLPSRVYNVWHDRAVFHFLTSPEQRGAYVRQLASALKAGGTAVMATFGPDGPQKCSGLHTVRYDHVSLQEELGPPFRLLRHSIVEHRTPWGTTQQFLYAMFRLEFGKVAHHE
jgi:2-polyprenyl-3-methyl-5-hydroxy-6-metoxy-1,4-benzoquinol methylase